MSFVPNKKTCVKLFEKSRFESYFDPDYIFFAFCPLSVLKSQMSRSSLISQALQARKQGSAPPPEKEVPLRKVQTRKKSSAQVCRQEGMHVQIRQN